MREWVCSRFFILAALACLFANTTEGPYTILTMLLSAGLHGFLIWLLSVRWVHGSRKREWALLAAGSVLLLCVQAAFLLLAGGYPADETTWLSMYAGLPVLGRLLLDHWNLTRISTVLCVDLSMALCVGFVLRTGRRPGRGTAVFYLLFWLVGCSPWILMAPPALLLMPVAALLLWTKERYPVLSGMGLGLLCLFCLWLTGMTDIRIMTGPEGNSVPAFLLRWLESGKDAVSDGMFGWKNAPVLTPFSGNGWALRLQNTIYPTADRYGWYAMAAQGCWAVVWCLLAFLPPAKTGRETIYCLPVFLLFPFGVASGVCQPVALLLPWLAEKAVWRKDTGIKIAFGDEVFVVTVRRHV